MKLKALFIPHVRLRTPRPLQRPVSQLHLVSTQREAFGELRAKAKRELDDAREALTTCDDEPNQRRFVQALFAYDRLQGTLPFVAGGAADEQV